MPFGEVRSGSKMKRTLGLFVEEPSEDDAEGLLGMVVLLQIVQVLLELEHLSE
jgi:hypothetical protein